MQLQKKTCASSLPLNYLFVTLNWPFDPTKGVPLLPKLPLHLIPPVYKYLGVSASFTKYPVASILFFPLTAPGVTLLAWTLSSKKYILVSSTKKDLTLPRFYTPRFSRYCFPVSLLSSIGGVIGELGVRFLLSRPRSSLCVRLPGHNTSWPRAPHTHFWGFQWDLW